MEGGVGGVGWELATLLQGHGKYLFAFSRQLILGEVPLIAVMLRGCFFVSSADH